MRIQMKIWFEEGEEKVFGEGPCRLLKLVKKQGSLRKAAAEMGMSYSKAWSLVGLIEKQLSIQLLQTSVGGPEGGGSTITKEAEALIEAYERVRKGMEEHLEGYNTVVDDLFQSCGPPEISGDGSADENPKSR